MLGLTGAQYPAYIELPYIIVTVQINDVSYSSSMFTSCADMPQLPIGINSNMQAGMGAAASCLPLHV